MEKLTAQQDVEKYFRKLGLHLGIQPKIDDAEKKQEIVSRGCIIFSNGLPTPDSPGIVKEQKNNGNNGHH